MQLDYSVERNENNVVVDASKWIKNSSNLVHTYRMSGRDKVTNIIEVVDTYITEDYFSEAKEVLTKGRCILLSKLASNILSDLKNQKNRNIFPTPVMQVIGYFKENKISLDSLELLYNKVLFEKIEVNHGLLYTQDYKTVVGKVVKCGTHKFNKKWEKEDLRVKKDDIILVKDNVVTPIMFDGKEYLAVEEENIVGIFNSEKYSLDNISFINNYIIMQESKEDIKLKDTLLQLRLEDYDMIDCGDFYNNNIFRVIYCDNNLTKVRANDRIVVDNNITNYMYFNNIKYHVINDENSIEARIETVV